MVLAHDKYVLLMLNKIQIHIHVLYPHLYIYKHLEMQFQIFIGDKIEPIDFLKPNSFLYGAHLRNIYTHKHFNFVLVSWVLCLFFTVADDL